MIFKLASPTMLICYDTEYKERDVDVEAVVPIKKSISSSDKVKVYESPGLEQALKCPLTFVSKVSHLR